MEAYDTPKTKEEDYVETVVVLHPDKASEICIADHLEKELGRSINVVALNNIHCLDKILEAPKGIKIVITEEHLGEEITGTQLINKYKKIFPDIEYILYTSDDSVTGENTVFRYVSPSRLAKCVKARYNNQDIKDILPTPADSIENAYRHHPSLYELEKDKERLIA